MLTRFLSRLRWPVILTLVLGTGGIASHAVFGADAARDACTPSDRSATCRYQKGVLWKLERSGSNPSYLFGTIHVADRRVTDLPPIVRDTFNSARSFTMELLIDGSGLAQMAETMFFTDGRTLEAAIGAQRYAAVQRLFAERGLPQTDLQRQKPWVIVMMLSSPRPGGIALDLQLQLDAMQQQKPTHGLETLAEQLAVFNELALDDQLALLDATLRQAPKLDAMIESMVQAYLARDLARVMAIMDSSALEDRRLQETVMARLVTTRNQRMFERMRPRLDEGSAFIAVGAAHLAGRGGLLPLLEQAGWRVTPVY